MALALKRTGESIFQASSLYMLVSRIEFCIALTFLLLIIPKKGK